MFQDDWNTKHLALPSWGKIGIGGNMPKTLIKRPFRLMPIWLVNLSACQKRYHKGRGSGNFIINHGHNRRLMDHSFLMKYCLASSHLITPVREAYFNNYNCRNRGASANPTFFQWKVKTIFFFLQRRGVVTQVLRGANPLGFKEMLCVRKGHPKRGPKYTHGRLLKPGLFLIRILHRLTCVGLVGLETDPEFLGRQKRIGKPVGRRAKKRGKSWNGIPVGNSPTARF